MKIDPESWPAFKASRRMARSAGRVSLRVAGKPGGTAAYFRYDHTPFSRTRTKGPCGPEKNSIQVGRPPEERESEPESLDLFHLGPGARVLPNKQIPRPIDYRATSSGVNGLPGPAILISKGPWGIGISTVLGEVSQQAFILDKETGDLSGTPRR
jgi:hypothetical protein